MTIGPIQVRWTKTVKAEHAEAQRLWFQRQRLIVGQSHDIQALRHTVVELKAILKQRRADATEQYVDLLRRSKPPKAGARAS